MGKRKTKQNFNKRVTDIVKQELSNEIEEKQCITQYQQVPLIPAIPSGLVFNGQGNFFKLMPEIFQSTTGGSGSAYNERIGNEIMLKHLDIHGYLSYNTQSVPTVGINDENAKIAVRVMILKAKEINDQNLLFDNMPTDTLIRFGNPTGGVAGPVPYSGAPLDSFSDINRDTFAVRYDKVHYLNAPTVLTGIDNPKVSLVPSALKIFRHRLKFGKGLKLKYSASTDLSPNNFPYFMVIGYSSMSSTTVPSGGIVNATFNISGAYTDA